MSYDIFFKNKFSRNWSRSVAEIASNASQSDDQSPFNNKVLAQTKNEELFLDEYAKEVGKIFKKAKRNVFIKQKRLSNKNEIKREISISDPATLGKKLITISTNVGSDKYKVRNQTFSNRGGKYVINYDITDSIPREQMTQHLSLLGPQFMSDVLGSDEIIGRDEILGTLEILGRDEILGEEERAMACEGAAERAAVIRGFNSHTRYI